MKLKPLLIVAALAAACVGLSVATDDHEPREAPYATQHALIPPIADWSQIFQGFRHGGH